MADEKRWLKERKTEDGDRIDVVSWGKENGSHDHEVIKIHEDGDVDDYKWTHPDKKKKE